MFPHWGTDFFRIANCHEFETSEIFLKFAEFSDKIQIYHYCKRAQICHPVTPCVSDQDATTVPARQMLETGSLNGLQFMFK